MSQQQHPKQQPPPPTQPLQHQQQQQPSQAILSNAIVPSQPIFLASNTNVNHHQSLDYSQFKANTTSQQNINLNPDQQLITTDNHQQPLQLNTRSPIETVPISSPNYLFQPYNRPEPTTSTVVDLESNRFSSGARSSSNQQTASHYSHTQHYYPSTPATNYSNYTNYTPLPPQSHLLHHQHHPRQQYPFTQLNHHHLHHLNQQQQQPRHQSCPYTNLQKNGYCYYTGQSSYNTQAQVQNITYPTYPSLPAPQQSQTKPMSVQTTKPVATTKPGPKLIWLLFMHRHGDRTPLNMAPRDKYNNITYWPEGFGNLNNAGRMRMFKLGKFIRRRYDGFLTDNVREVYSRSSDVDRCIESSHALLAGLYPPASRFEWNKELLWVPAPVHTVPGPDDYFLGSLKVSYTPSGTSDQIVEFINEIHLVQNSEEVKKLYEDSVVERELLERELGYEFDMFHRFKCTYSTLDIEERNGLAMPAWYTPELKQKLYRFAGIAFSLAGGGTEKLKKIRCGHLLEDLVTRMEMASIEGPKVKEQSDFQQLTDAPTMIDDRKIIHYSTHDSNMAAFLEALNVNNPTPVPPGFGATFFVELYVDLNEQGLPVSEKYIKLFYMDDTDAEKPIEKKLPNAKLNEKGYLTLNNFRKYVANLLPGNSHCTK